MTACRLHEAAKANKVKELERLLDQGYHVDLVEGGFTALYLAVEAGHMNCVQFLLARKANPNARCLGGATAVHVACLRGLSSIVQQLVICGGDLRLRDDEGRTPCEWARECPDPAARSRVIELILRKRSDAYRLAERYSDAKRPTADGCSLLKRRLSSGSQRRKWCTERLVTDGGFGSLYQWDLEVGIPTHISYVSPGLLLIAEDARSIWAGPMAVLQTMYRDSLKVTVKRSTVNKRLVKGFRSDVILQEIENIRRLSPHPHYLWPLAIAPTENMEDAFIVYESVHFGSLFEVLHYDVTPKLPTVSLFQMLRQVCEALIYLHETGYVHACVNPHAVAVVSASQAKLSGFEFLQDERAQPNDCRKFTIGDRSIQDYYFHWLAPEVLAKGAAKQASDLYSLAAVIWETFTGSVPWCDEDLDTVYQQTVVQKKSLPMPDDMPPSLATVIHRALMPTIGQRETSLDEMYQALSSIIDVASQGESWPVTHNRRITLYSGQIDQLNRATNAGRRGGAVDISMRSSFRTPPPYLDDSEGPSLYTGDIYETANMSSSRMAMNASKPLPEKMKKPATMMSTPKRPPSVSSRDSDGSNVSVDLQKAKRVEGMLMDRLAKLGSAFVSSSSKFISSPGKTRAKSESPSCVQQQQQQQQQRRVSSPQQRPVGTHPKYAYHVSNVANLRKSMPIGQKFSHLLCTSPTPRADKSLRFENDESDDESVTTEEENVVFAPRRVRAPPMGASEAVYARVAKPTKAHPSAPPVPPKKIDEVDGLTPRMRDLAFDGEDRGCSQITDHMKAFRSVKPLLRPFLVERNRSYKLEVVTDAEPTVRHHLRIIETNRDTGEVKISEEVSGGASIGFEFVSGGSDTPEQDAGDNEPKSYEGRTSPAHFQSALEERDITEAFIDCPGAGGDALHSTAAERAVACD